MCLTVHLQTKMETDNDIINENANVVYDIEAPFGNEGLDFILTQEWLTHHIKMVDTSLVCWW